MAQMSVRALLGSQLPLSYPVPKELAVVVLERPRPFMAFGGRGRGNLRLCARLVGENSEGHLPDRLSDGVLVACQLRDVVALAQAGGLALGDVGDGRDIAHFVVDAQVAVEALLQADGDDFGEAGPRQ